MLKKTKEKDKKEKNTKNESHTEVDDSITKK